MGFDDESSNLGSLSGLCKTLDLSVEILSLTFNSSNLGGLATEKETLVPDPITHIVWAFVLIG